MTPDQEQVVFHIRSLTPFIWVQTPDVYRWMSFLEERLKTMDKRTFVYSPFAKQGSCGLKDYPGANLEVKRERVGLEAFLTSVQANDPSNSQYFYIVPNVTPTREVTDLLRSFQTKDELRSKVVRLFIFLNAGQVPSGARDLFQEVDDQGPSPQEVAEYVKVVAEAFMVQLPEGTADSAKGLTNAQIGNLVAQALIRQKKLGSVKDPFPLSLIQEIRESMVGGYERPFVPTTLEEACVQISRAVYDATQMFEHLERRGLVQGNGHHARQKISQMAADQLFERWINK